MVDNTGSDGGDYQYDQYNRLTYVQAGTYFRYYQYDPFGNIRDFSALTLDYATNATGAPATNRISSDGVGGNYSYDEAGNMTAGMGQSYAYDGANRLKTAGYGSSAYGYDGDGIRVKKAENGATTYYVQSSALKNTAMEVNSTGVLRAYVYGGSSKLVAMQATNGQFYWLHTNHLNSSRAMTDTNGNLTYKGQFDPYGQALSEWSSAGNINLNTKKFTGYERDGATGLDYAKARMYSSGRGRFVTPDPINIRAANKQRPQTLNRYSYVSNDPINYIDASGTCLVFWSQVNETYGFWDTSLCYPGGDALPMPEMPGEPPPVPVGVETEQSKNGKDRLLNKLNHLPKECIDAFGGQNKIDSWIGSINEGKVNIYAYDNDSANIPNSPLGETVRQYWDRVNPNAIAHTVFYNIWGNGYRDFRTYGTIILGDAYYNPDAGEGRTRLTLAGGNIDTFKENVLLHEFLHWESNGEHQIIFDKLNLGSRGYDSSDPALALDQFIASGCKDKTK